MTSAFQRGVAEWMRACFTKDVSNAPAERNHRFLEESLELVQSRGSTREEAHMLVDYVFGRPVGEKEQEVGGVMVTLAALCHVAGMDMVELGDRELRRIWNNIEKIRAKQATKPASSPLPGGSQEHQVGCATNKPGWFKGPCNCIASRTSKTEVIENVIISHEELDGLIKLMESGRSNASIDLSAKRRDLIVIALQRLRNKPTTGAWDDLKSATGGKL